MVVNCFFFSRDFVFLQFFSPFVSRVLIMKTQLVSDLLVSEIDLANSSPGNVSTPGSEDRTINLGDDDAGDLLTELLTERGQRRGQRGGRRDHEPDGVDPSPERECDLEFSNDNMGQKKPVLKNAAPTLFNTQTMSPITRGGTAALDFGEYEILPKNDIPSFDESSLGRYDFQPPSRVLASETERMLQEDHDIASTDSLLVERKKLSKTTEQRWRIYIFFFLDFFHFFCPDIGRVLIKTRLVSESPHNY